MTQFAVRNERAKVLEMPQHNRFCCAWLRAGYPKFSTHDRNGGSVPTETETVPMTAAEKMQPLFVELRHVPGVEAVYRGRNGHVFYVVTREHRDIDWDQLMAAEDMLRELDPEADVNVRAHQGRDVGAMFLGLEQI
ncbi:MAG: hypothetical protein WDO69_23865 [Pseudomonadota bacterium]